MSIVVACSIKLPRVGPGKNLSGSGMVSLLADRMYTKYMRVFGILCDGGSRRCQVAYPSNCHFFNFSGLLLEFSAIMAVLIMNYTNLAAMKSGCLHYTIRLCLRGHISAARENGRHVLDAVYPDHATASPLQTP